MVCKRNIFVYIFLCLLVSCNLFVPKSIDSTADEPTFTPNIAWTLDTDAFMTRTEIILKGKHIYAAESNWIFERKDGYKKANLAKIDVETGTYVWKTETRDVYEKTEAVFCESLVFVLLNDGLMHCYDDDDGSLLASIRFEDTIEESKDNACKNKRMFCFGKYLYWANLVADFSRPWGIMKFDTSQINFEENPETVQIIKPELILTLEKRSPLAEPLLSAEGILYFLTYNARFEDGEGYSLLCALDVSKEEPEVIWEHQLEYMKGITRNSLILHGDNLYVIDMQVACFNRHTGEPIYEHIQTYDDYMKEVCLAASTFLTGIFYYEDKLYYTTQAYYGGGSDYGTPEKYNKNILCIDARTGKYVWGDMAKGSGSLGTRPIVYNGKAYVVSDCGLRVYEADTGKLIGVDKTVVNAGDQPNALYEGKIIFFNNDYDRRKAVLTAINAE